MPETGGERRHVPLYGRLVAEEQLASMSAPSDIQVSSKERTPRAFCRYCAPKVNDARGSSLGQCGDVTNFLTLADDCEGIRPIDYTQVSSEECNSQALPSA